MIKGQSDLAHQRLLLKDEHQIIVCHHCNQQVKVTDEPNENDLGQNAVEEMAEWVGVKTTKTPLGVVTKNVYIAAGQMSVSAD